MGKSNIDKTCFSKSAYDTYEDAMETAEYILLTEHVRLFPYKCPICGSYHLTSQKVRKRK